MLVIFKSKAAGNLYMFEENARQILDLFGKDVSQGIITVAELDNAIRILEEEIAQKKIQERQEREEQEAEERRLQEEEENKDPFEEEEEEEEEEKDPFEKKQPPPKKEIPVPFSARAYPFLQMLYRAQKKERDIVWGV